MRKISCCYRTFLHIDAIKTAMLPLCITMHFSYIIKCLRGRLIAQCKRAIARRAKNENDNRAVARAISFLFTAAGPRCENGYPPRVHSGMLRSSLSPHVILPLIATAEKARRTASIKYVYHPLKS